MRTAIRLPTVRCYEGKSHAAMCRALECGAGPSSGTAPRRPPGLLSQHSSASQVAAAVQEDEAAPLLQVSSRKESRLRQMHFKGITLILSV